MLEICQPSSGIQSNKVKCKAPFLRCFLSCWFGNKMDLTPFTNFNSASTCFLISFCFTSKCHLSLSIDSYIGTTSAGSRRTLVAKTSINSKTRALSHDCCCGDPLKVIFDIHSSCVSVDPSSESALNGLTFHSMSLSSGSYRSFVLMSSSSEIVG